MGAISLELDNGSLVFNLFASGMVSLPQLSLVVLRKMRWNLVRNTIIVCQFRLDDPWCTSPGLSRDSVLQERSYPLLSERFALTRDMLIVATRLFIRLDVESYKVSCKGFAFKSTIRPRKLGEFRLFPDPTGKSSFSDRYDDMFTRIEVVFELLFLGQLCSNMPNHQIDRTS